MTQSDLKVLQAYPLNLKIKKSLLRINEFYDFFAGNVCVAYSGGKDSTVLLHLVRSVYPNVPAVYADTRLDYPEVREHVKNTDNVIFLKPEKNFRQVIDEYGWCYPSKEIATYVEGARKGREWCKKRLAGFNSDGSVSKLSTYFKKWAWLVDSDLKISPKCCDVMKERPFKKFFKETGMAQYVGTLASESLRRRYSWYQTGCNAFKSGKSKPLSFWTEQDILRYIIDYDLAIPSVYGGIIADKHGKLKCGGVNRTGCVFCPISCRYGNFQKVKESHPELYRYCMEELGLGDFLTAVSVDH